MRLPCTVGKCGGSTDSATRTIPAVQTILRNDGLDGRHLPNLMPPRCFVIGDEFTTAAAASIGMTFNDFVASLRRHQLSRVLFMAFLSAMFELRLGLLFTGLVFVVMRMNGARWH